MRSDKIQTEMKRLKDFKKIHFIGIKGIGTSALAVIAKNMGFNVSGSDISDVFISDVLLEQESIPVTTFNKANITSDSAIVYSVAYDYTNEEMKEAKDKNLSMYTYPQAVGELMDGYIGIGVSGCNGKTTTSSMLAWTLFDNNLKPTFVIGGPVSNLGVNAKYGEGKYFVVEADEYRKAFLNYARHLKHAVITNIEWDHPDCYPSIDDMLNAYTEFIDLLGENATVYVFDSDKNIERVLESSKRKDIKVIKYGFKEDSDYVITNVKYESDKSIFDIYHKGKLLDTFELKVPGEHNVLNATACIVLTSNLGLDTKNIKKSLACFIGSKRRFEVKGERNGVTIIDDYAHHPTAIRVTLKAVRQFYGKKRVWCVFQSHTFSRTKALLKEFSESFKDSDIVIIPDIYASAREKDLKDISSKDLVRETKKHHKNVRYIPKIEDVVKTLRKETKDGDVVIVLGAGDMWKSVAEPFLKD